MSPLTTQAIQPAKQDDVGASTGRVAGRNEELCNHVWVTRSFLDYRVPVYAALDRMVEGRLTVIYNAAYVPERAQDKLRAVLGNRAVGMRGERRMGPDAFSNHMANRAVRIPWQPGLMREIRKRKPGILISDGFFQWTAACLWLRARRGIPHVMCYERTAHTERNAQWYRNVYRKWATRYVDAVCCSGRLCTEYSRFLGLPSERMTRGHMVADVEGLRRAFGQLSSHERQQLTEQHDLRGAVVLYVGRLVPMKGIQELLHSWRTWQSRRDAKDATLLLVGDGPEREASEKFCREHGVSSIRFAGAVDYDRIAPYYAVADVFVIPTLEDNWSLVVPEAMACGLPILCSKYNGCWPELVHEGENGWIFDPLDIADFERVLAAATSDQTNLAMMGERSRQIVAEHTPGKAAEAILEACRIARHHACYRSMDG